MPHLTKIILNNCGNIAWQPKYTAHVTHSGLMHTISLDIPTPTSVIDAILIQNWHLIELRLPASGLFSQNALDRMASGELVPRLEIMECYLPKDGPVGIGAHLDMIESWWSMGTTVCSNISILEHKLHSQFSWPEDSFSHESQTSTSDRMSFARIRKLHDDGWSRLCPVSMTCFSFCMVRETTCIFDEISK